MRTKRAELTAIRVMSNPLAFRLLTAIGTRGPQTTGEIASMLHDVPVSSLYRQLSRLRRAGVLRVTGERQARGAVERTYALASREAGAFRPSDIPKLPITQLRATLRNFIATMVADTTAFVDSPAFSRSRSQTRAGLVTCKLTDSEYAKVLSDVTAAMTQYRDRTKTPRSVKRRSFYIFALPEQVQ